MHHVKIKIILVLCMAAGLARAQTDEIQVYDASIADQGQISVDWHNNYTPVGRKRAELPGGVAPNHALNGAAEFAYGVAEWFEAGLYLPVYSIRSDGRAEIDSAKLRALFVTPWAGQRSFFYGVNFELSYNAFHWEPTRISGEIRPIAGLHLGDWDLIVNPILDTGFKGVGRLDFAPAERVAYNLSPEWALALEHYADFGALDDWQPGGRQAQTLFAVLDYRQEDVGGVEFGVGHGFTAASDDVVLKLILGLEF
jgi:hypothetical protein